MKTLGRIFIIIMLLSLTAVPTFALDYTDEQLLAYFGMVENWTVDDLNKAGLKEGDVVFDELMNWDLAYTEEEAQEMLTNETPIESVVTEPEYEGKAIVTALEGGAGGSYVPCGDGKLQVSIQLKNVIQLPLENNGEPMVVYIRSVVISGVSGDPTNGSYTLMDCKDASGAACEKIMLGSDGTATISGHVTIPQVYNSGNISCTATLTYSKAEGAASEPPLVISGNATPTELSMCASGNLDIVASKGTYEQCGGKAAFTADIQVPAAGIQFIVPADLLIRSLESTNVTVYETYECRFTRFDETSNPISGGACEPGQRIEVFPNDKIRLEMFIDKLNNPIEETSGEKALEINWRLGGINGFLSGQLESKVGPAELCAARIVPLAPLAPAAGTADNPLEPEQFWNITHNNAVTGVYQKCGKFAVIQLRLRNEGAKAGKIMLPGYVSVNGGTPITYYWMSTLPAEGNQITLEPGQTVSLVGRLYLTNVTSQTAADTPVLVVVMFPELNMIMGGEAISDKNTERCYTVQ